MITKQFKTALTVYRKHGIAGISQVLLQKLSASKNVISGPVDDIWTDYMTWLEIANVGWLARGNAHCFDYAIKHLPSSAPIVEIGSFCGLSANMMTYLKEKYAVRNTLITCDRWLFREIDQDDLKIEGAEVDQSAMIGDSKIISHSDYHEFVKETFIRNVKMFSRYDLPYTIELFSDEFFHAWSKGEPKNDVLNRKITLGGPISFCYIDGNHSYEFARRDFENTDAHLESGGFLLFDDSADDSGWEVCKVVREVMSTGRYELVAKNPNYFFQKK